MANNTKEEQELLGYLDANFEVDQAKKTFKPITINSEQAELYKTIVRKRYGQSAYTNDDTKMQYRGFECLRVGYNGNNP